MSYEVSGKVLIKNGVLIGTFETDELIEYLIEELNDKDKELDSALSDAYETRNELDSVESDMDVLSTNYSYLERTNEDLEIKNISLQEEIYDLKAEIAILERELSEVG